MSLLAPLALATGLAWLQAASAQLPAVLVVPPEGVFSESVATPPCEAPSRPSGGDCGAASGLGSSSPPKPPATAPERRWVGELVSELLPRSLALAGVGAVERADRLRAQAALEIPMVRLTRATSIRLAEALGARRLVTGTYAVKDEALTLSLRMLDVERASLSAPVVATGPLHSVGDLVHGAAWDLALASGSAPTMAREDFAARRPAASFAALEALGQALISRKPVIQARLLRKAIGAAPQLHDARLALGRVQLEGGEFSAANYTLSRIPSSSHLARSARFLQGLALQQIGRYSEAGTIYAALAAERPTPAVLSNQGLAVLRSGRRDTRGSDLLRRALEQQPDSADVAFNLGWALLLEGDPAAAEFFLRGGLRRDPLDGHARVVLAWALRKAGQAEAAAQEWRGVLAMAPIYETLTNPDFTRRFERILPSERLPPGQRAVRSEGEVAAGLVGRADRRLAGGDAEGALRDLVRAVYLDPHTPGVHLLLARAYRTRGDRERALNEFRMTLWSQEDASVRAELAELLKEMGRNAEARVEAEKVLRLDPANERARKVLAAVSS